MNSFNQLISSSNNNFSQEWLKLFNKKKKTQGRKTTETSRNYGINFKSPKPISPFLRIPIPNIKHENFQVRDFLFCF